MNRLSNAGLFAVMKIFETEKFLRDFVFSSTSYLNFMALYIEVPNKVVHYKKCVCSFSDVGTERPGVPWPPPTFWQTMQK